MLNPHDYKSQEDFTLVTKLLNGNPRYNIPERLRDKILLNAEKVMDDIDTKSNTKVAAARLILEADKLNIELLKLALPKKIDHFNVKTASDAELLEAIRETRKLLPSEYTIHEKIN